MPYEEIAELLQQGLKLDMPPVAVALVDGPPAGVQRLQEKGPSACSYWRSAEKGVFYASAEDHFNCPIGAMVMGFALPDSVNQDLMGLVTTMFGMNYIKPEEIQHIPKFQKQAKGIVYGPLAGFPLEPTTVVMWPTPAQAMLLQEWSGASSWAENPQGLIFGRPGCGVLPVADGRAAPAMSLGCAGMRTFTEVPDDKCLLVLPGAALAGLREGLQKVLEVNEQMRGLYLAKKGAA